MAALSIVSFFRALPDPRHNTPKYALAELVVVTVAAILCGARTWDDVALFGKTHRAWVRRCIGLKRVPSHDTFARVFSLLDPGAFEARFIAWMEMVAGDSAGSVLAVDGKVLRGSAAPGQPPVVLVSAWSCANGLSLGQASTLDKSNEIPAVQGLLELLDLRGTLVTADAMHCPTETVERIVRRGGDYLLAVKGNQKYLADTLATEFELADQSAPGTLGRHVSHDDSRGRAEVRDVQVLPARAAFGVEWLGAQSLVRVTSQRTINDEIEITVRHQ